MAFGNKLKYLMSVEKSLLEEESFVEDLLNSLRKERLEVQVQKEELMKTLKGDVKEGECDTPAPQFIPSDEVPTDSESEDGISDNEIYELSLDEWTSSEDDSSSEDETSSDEDEEEDIIPVYPFFDPDEAAEFHMDETQE